MLYQLGGVRHSKRVTSSVSLLDQFFSFFFLGLGGAVKGRLLT